MDVKWKTVYIVITVLMLNCSLSYCTIVFRREPTDKTVIQGNPVTFHCVTENTQSSGASLQIQWKLNGNYINTGTRHLLFQNGSLYISQTQAADQGDYVCVVIVIGQPGSTESRPAHLSFAYINVVAHSPQSVNAEDGQMRPAYFQCVSGKSQPLVSIHWEKDGVTFTEGVTYQTEFAEPGSLQISGTLQINNVKKDHEGSYRCVTVNPYLPNQPMRSDYATLTVNPLYGPPYIEVAPQNVTAGLNNPASIECTIVGNPQPVISWHKAGESQPIQSTATRFILDGTLQFTQVQQYDEGAYICTGSNSQGSISTNPVYLIIASMQSTFIQEPSDVFSVLGSSVTLHCTPPISNPPATVQWYKDNIQIVSSTSFTQQDNGDMYISSLALPDTGDYFCAATNSYIPRTLTSRTATLTIQVGALITEPPQNMKVSLHNSVDLTCRADGDPKPSITWFKDQIQIDNDRYGSRYLVSSSGEILSISDVIYIDQGTYVCEARNNANIDRASAFLDVIVPADIVRAPPMLLSARVGSTVVINCEVTGDPNPTVTWYKDNFQLVWSNHNEHYISTTRGLQILDVVVGDAGSYRCHAENEAGTDEATGDLLVEDIPVILQGPLDQTVNEGSSVTMTCQAAAFPEPNYSWLYNNGILPPQAIVSQDGRTLNFASAEDDNTGTYTCKVRNLHGEDDASATLFVRVAPSMDPILDIQIRQGDPLSVTAFVVGKPTPTIQWLKAHYQLIEDSRTTFPADNILQIDQVSVIDEGEYHCIAHNPAGSVRMTFQVKVLVVVSTPSMISATAESTREITISWFPGTITTSILYYIIQYKPRYGNEWQTYSDSVQYTGGTQTYTVSGLQPSTYYTFLIIATLQDGPSQPSNQMSATTFADVRIEPSAPGNLQVIDETPTSIQLRWEVPDDISDDIVMYEVEYIQLGTPGVNNFEVRANGLTVLTTVLSNLLPLTSYTFRVRAAISVDSVNIWSPYTDSVPAQTLHGAPPIAPYGLFVQSNSRDTIYVSWQPLPSDVSSDVIKYEIQCIDTTTSDEILTEVIGALVSEIIITSLKPWREYTVRVRAHTLQFPGQYSDPQTVRTQVGAPSAPPQNLQAGPVSGDPQRLWVSWEEVIAEERNGRIDGYLLQCWQFNLSDALTINVANGDQYREISKLSPFTLYTIRILAYNIISNGQRNGGPYTEMTTQTAEGLPGRVENLEIVKGTRHLYVVWQSPPVESRNGIITDYVIKYAVSSTVQGNPTLLTEGILEGFKNSTHGHVATDDQSYNISGLLSGKRYIVSVTARTIAGVGLDPAVVSESTVTVSSPGSTGGSTTNEDTISATTSQVTTDWWTIPPKDMPVFIGAMVAIGLSILGVLLFGIWYCRHRHKKERKRQTYLIPPGEGNTKKTRSQSQTSNGSQGRVELNGESASAHYSKRSISIFENISQRERADGMSSLRSEVAFTTTIDNESVYNEGSIGVTDISTHSEPMQVKRLDDNKNIDTKVDIAGTEQNSNFNNINTGLYDGNDPTFHCGYNTLDELQLSNLPVNGTRIADGTCSAASCMSTPVSKSNNVTPREMESYLPGFSSSSDYSCSPTPDELDDLYVKVNFSMKKKNRKKRDSAAAIAAMMIRQEDPESIEIQSYDNPLSVIVLSNEKTVM